MNTTTLREAFALKGYQIEQGRGRHHEGNKGGYQITIAATNRVIRGERYDLTLEDLKRELSELPSARAITSGFDVDPLDTIDDPDTIRRATEAWLQSQRDAGQPETKPDDGSHVIKYDDRIYVVLESASHTLAIYEEKTDGTLEPACAWPSGVSRISMSPRSRPASAL